MDGELALSKKEADRLMIVSQVEENEITVLERIC
jgi:hypothetical protein